MSTHALGYHVTMRLESGHVLTPETADRRRAALIFHEVGARFALLAFRVADSHAHALVIGSRRDAGLLARHVAVRLQRNIMLAGPFAPARFRPIEDQWHLERAFDYLLRQEEHHGINLDPRHDASSGPDLVGMRITGSHLAQRVRVRLPRLRDDAVWSAMRLVTCPPDYDRLADAAAAAIAVPALAGVHAKVIAARAAAIHAAPDLTTGEVADRLGVTRRCVERARNRPQHPALIAAIGKQLTARPAATTSAATSVAAS